MPMTEACLGRGVVIAALSGVLISSAAAQGWTIPQPSPGLMPNPGQGKGLYTQHCAACHGTDLKGSDKGPPMLHKVYEPSHHADIAFQLAVANGVRAHHWQFGDMAPVPGLDDDEIDVIIAYIRDQQEMHGFEPYPPE